MLSLEPMTEGRTCVKRWHGKHCVGILHMKTEEEVSSESLRDFLETYREKGEIPD